MASEDGETRRGFRVHGRVQGVGFRWWTQQRARELGLGGSVRNLPEGGVEVHVVGPEELVSLLERALHDGPAGARVERVERVEPVAADRTASASDFVIVR